MKYLINALILMSALTINAQQWDFLEEIAPDGSAQSDYGIRTVFADGMLVVSWPKIFTNGNDAQGCGEIITYNQDSNGAYQEVSRLTALELTGSCDIGDGFGESLQFDQGRLAIGMAAGQRKGWGFSGTSTDTDARVFITHFENDNWVLDDTLMADDLVDGQQGMAVRMVLEGNILLVEANEYENIFGVQFSVSNGVYVFEDSGNGFQQVQKLEENFHLYALSFDYENDQIIVGSFGEQNISTAGRVFVYEKANGMWVNTQVINDNRNINLGTDVHILGNTMAIGGVHAGGIGGVAIYTKDTTGSWNETQFIEASDKRANDQFGFEAELLSDELIVGAPNGHDPALGQGAVYVFNKDDNGNYVESQKLIANIQSQLSNNFGGNVTYNETELLINSASGGFGGEATSFHHFSRLGATGNSTYPAGRQASGSWKVDGTTNQNIEIEMLQDGRAVLFGSLNKNGENFWILAIGQVNENIIDFAHVISTSGASFGLNFNSADVVKNDIGQIQIAFNQCDKAILSYDLPNISTAEVTISKSKEVPGNECQVVYKTLPNGVSGAWFDPSRSGEGFTHYLYEVDNVQMSQITWYTYDLNGNQMWLIGNGLVNGQSVNISEMKMYTGANLFSGATSQTVVGSLTMTWDSCHTAQMSYDFIEFGLGDGEYQLSQLTILDNTTCNLRK